METLYFLFGVLVACVGLATMRLILKTVIVCLGAAYVCRVSEK